MADPAHRPPAGPGRNKSFRKAREAAEEAHYLDLSLEDVHKYVSPDTWKKVSGTQPNPSAAPLSQKYFDPVAWEKLQRLGSLRGRPSTTTSSSASSTSTSAAASPDVTPKSVARGCLSPRSWDPPLTRLNMVPAAPGQAPRSPRRAGDDVLGLGGLGDEEDDDGFLGRGMNEYEDDTSLSSLVRLDGLEGGRYAVREPAPRLEVADRLRQFLSHEQGRKLEDRRVLEKTIRRLSRETSV